MNEPIRILHVLGNLNRGGAETMVMNLYRNMDRNRIQFDFIIHTDKECSYDDEITALGGRIYRISNYSGYNHFRYKKSWNIFFETHKEFKIIHGHIRSTASIYLQIAKKYGLITIAHSHSSSSGRGFSAIVKSIMQYPIRFIADYFIACSNQSGLWLFGKNVIKRQNYFILNNAIEVNKYKYNSQVRFNKRLELNIQNKFVIGHVGNFHKPKNHEFLVDIFKEIHNENNNAILLLIGDGKLRFKIEKKIIDSGLTDSVKFLGVRPDISELLQAMDVFVFPSLYEGLGMAVIEAQASGLPCIVSNTLPKEVAITELVKYIPIKKPASYWSSNILEYCSNYDRVFYYDDIIKSGYDINTTANWLINFYMKIYKN